MTVRAHGAPVLYMTAKGVNSITLKDVDYSYPGSRKKALQSVNFALNPGDFTVLTGVSGSGKTTLIRALRGEIVPTSGDLRILGRYVRKRRNIKSLMLRRRIAVVYQDFKLIHNKTVFDNVAYPLEVAGYCPAAVRARAMDSLHALGLEGYADKYPKDISGGEAQRVAIARAIGMKPDVLLADEPTGNLDVRSAAKVFSVLQNLSCEGAAVLVSTHNTIFARSVGGRMHVMEEGELFTPGESLV